MTLDGNTISTRVDYKNYKTEIASVSPTGTASAKYTATNKAAACPTLDSIWASSSKLPPKPDAQLCSCMMSTLECTLSSSVSSKDYGDLYGQLYNYGALDGVTGNSTKGVYGAYSMCTDEQKLSFALNEYYNSQSDENKAKACDFKGAATTTSSSAPSGTCSSLIEQAASGTGTVTSSPSGTGSSGGATSSGLGVPMNTPSSVVVGTWQLGAYVAVAVFTGAGMILL